MKCRFCGKDNKLIKSHVIPEGFFRILRDGQNPPRLLSNTEGIFPKKAPIGVYDTNILCEYCEPIFAEWDYYAQQLLQENPFNGKEIIHNNDLIGYEVENYDYDKIKLFFISMLWRASVSIMDFYKRINLGPFEDIAKNHIINADPGSENEFSISLAKFDHSLGKIILDPHKDKFDGVNYNRFYLGGYVAYIKVDKRPPPKSLRYALLKKGSPLLVVCRDLQKSKELPLMQDIVQTANKSFKKNAKDRRAF